MAYRPRVVIDEIGARDFKPSGIGNATSASRYVGATASGAPTSGTFATGDFAIDQSAQIWICTAAGSPGTWAKVLGSGGTVTSVALSTPSEFTVSGSPVTSSGTLTISLANENANLVWAGPTTGAAAAPTFRSLVNADIPSPLTIAGEITGSDFAPSGLTGATAASRYVGATTSGAPASGTFAKGDYIIDQTGKIFICTTAGSPGTWTTLSGSGTVTSVALSAPSILTVSGSPVTTSGTLTLSLASQSANTIFAGPNGSSGTPTFRTMVSADLPASPTVSGEVTASDFKASGLSGATGASRYVGATTGGAPASGTFAVGDFVVDQTGDIWICTAAGTPGSWVTVSAPADTAAWTTKSANYTVTTSDLYILVDATSAGVTITLPTAVGAIRPYTIKKKDSTTNAVTIATTLSQSIDGGSTYVIDSANESVTVVSDNANWYIA